jgi:hypothetical protein
VFRRRELRVVPLPTHDVMATARRRYVLFWSSASMNSARAGYLEREGEPQVASCGREGTTIKFTEIDALPVASGGIKAVEQGSLQATSKPGASPASAPPTTSTRSKDASST